MECSDRRIGNLRAVSLTLDDILQRHDLSRPGIGLELFAGSGEMFTSMIAAKTSKFVSIELDTSKADLHLQGQSGFAFILGNTIQILKLGNTIQILEEGLLSNRKIGLLSCDNPLGTFGSSQEYCEHFEVLAFLGTILADRCCVVFNVVPKLYDYENP